MAKYIEISTQIYNVYLKYIAPEDVHVYSSEEQNRQKEQPANTATGNQKSFGHLKGAKTIAR